MVVWIEDARPAVNWRSCHFQARHEIATALNWYENSTPSSLHSRHMDIFSIGARAFLLYVVHVDSMVGVRYPARP